MVLQWHLLLGGASVVFSWDFHEAGGAFMEKFVTDEITMKTFRNPRHSTAVLLSKFKDTVAHLRYQLQRALLRSLDT